MSQHNKVLESLAPTPWRASTRKPSTIAVNAAQPFGAVVTVGVQPNSAVTPTDLSPETPWLTSGTGLTGGGQLRRHVNLALELALTQFKLKYTGSVLGYLWSLLKPLMIFGIMWLVFANFLRVGRNSENFTLQLLLAVVLWSFFQESTANAISSVASSGHIIKKAYFPRWILVVSSTFTALLTLVINLGLILAIATPLGGVHLGLGSLVAPLLIAELFVLVLGVGLLLSALFVLFRDIGHIWEIVTTVLFYASAIVYPFSLVPLRFAHIVGLNPVAQIVEDMRRAVVTPRVEWMVQIQGLWLFLISPALVVAIGVVGWVVFHRLTPRFAEYL